MHSIRLLTCVTATAAAFLLAPSLGRAQTKDYFVPNQSAPRAAPGPGPRAVPPRAAPPRSTPPQMAAQPGPENEPPVQVPMPPVPELPALPKGTAPPAAVIGVIGVPEVMRASLAAQAVDKTITERREKLNEDAQKEQEAWRGMQQSLAAERGKLSPEQLRGREKELQDRITTAQRNFRDRNRILQEQTQFALNQIQASLIAVIRQVSESHGMNLVLHRAQVALNVNEFDVTEQVAEQLNKVLPAVTVPPEGVSPVQTATAPRGPVAVPATAPPKKP